MVDKIESHKQPVYKTIWFWLLIIAVIIIILAIVVKLVQSVTNALFWILIVVGVIAFFVAIILMIVWLMQPSKQKKIENISEQMHREFLIQTYQPQPQQIVVQS